MAVCKPQPGPDQDSKDDRKNEIVTGQDVTGGCPSHPGSHQDSAEDRGAGNRIEDRGQQQHDTQRTERTYRPADLCAGVEHIFIREDLGDGVKKQEQDTNAHQNAAGPESCL